MFGYNIREFVRNWFIVLLAAIVLAVIFLGYNSITGLFDPIAGFTTLVGMFGGLLSLIGLVIAIAILAFVVWGLNRIGKTDYSDNNAKLRLHVFIGVVVFLIASSIGWRWINIDGKFWPTVFTVVFALALITGITAIVTHRDKTARAKKVVTKKVTTTAKP